MGINLGAFLAPLVCGPLGERVGWGFGFAAAGIGMTLGLLTFVFTQRLLMGAGLPPGRKSRPRPGFGRATGWRSRDLGGHRRPVFGLIQAWPILRPLWSPAFLTSTAASFLYKSAILVGGLLLFLYATEPKKTGDQADQMHVPFTRVDWERIAVCVIISLFSIVFWMGFEQSGGTLNLFADQETNRTILGWNIPASVFQAINPVFIISLAPVFAILWTYLARHQFPLPSVTKQGLGLIMLAWPLE